MEEPKFSLSMISNLIVLIHIFTYLNLYDIFPNYIDGCSSIIYIFHQGKIQNLILSQFIHFDNWHISFDTLPFIEYAREIEYAMTSFKFGIMTFILLILNELIKFSLLFLTYFITGNDNYLYHCTIGFTGVNFSIQVVFLFLNKF